jgi:hypothetical protein
MIDRMYLSYLFRAQGVVKVGISTELHIGPYQQ